MGGEARVPKRGPKPNPNRGSPSGYRITARKRFELHVAGAFVGTETLQATIDMAVTEFLENLREVASGFDDALAAAEEHQQERSGIRRLVKPTRDDQ